MKQSLIERCLFVISEADCCIKLAHGFTSEFIRYRIVVCEVHAMLFHLTEYKITIVVVLGQNKSRLRAKVPGISCRIREISPADNPPSKAAIDAAPTK